MVVLARMNSTFHKIKGIGRVGETSLIAQFEGGVWKEYDVRQIVKKVRLEGSGSGVVWNDEYELSCNEIWDNGTVVDNPPNLLAMLIHDLKCTNPEDMHFAVFREAMEEALENAADSPKRDKS